MKPETTPIGGISFKEWVQSEIDRLGKIPMLEVTHGQAYGLQTYKRVLVEYERRPHD